LLFLATSVGLLNAALPGNLVQDALQIMIDVLVGEDETVEGVLAAEPNTVESLTAQPLPQPGFLGRHGATQFPGASEDRGVDMMVGLRVAHCLDLVVPSPLQLPPLGGEPCPVTSPQRGDYRGENPVHVEQ